jgi:hypothetical protein
MVSAMGKSMAFESNIAGRPSLSLETNKISEMLINLLKNSEQYMLDKAWGL